MSGMGDQSYFSKYQENSIKYKWSTFSFQTNGEEKNVGGIPSLNQKRQTRKEGRKQDAKDKWKKKKTLNNIGEIVKDHEV